MEPKLTIVFAPVGIRNGMAASKRVGNLVEFIKQRHHVINLYPDSKIVDEEQDGIVYKSYSSLKDERSILTKIKKENKGRKLVYFYYGYPSISNIYNLLWIKSKGFHIFFDIVEDHRTILQYKKGILKKFNLQATVWLLKWSKLFASGYIGISEYLCNMLNSFFAGKKPVMLLPISINPLNFPPTTNIEKHSKISFFYGGSYAPKDDFDVMLKAFTTVYKQHTSQIECFYLSGKCSQSKQREIMELAQKNNIDCIHFLGFLSDEEYYKYIRKADVLVMPRNNSEFANTGFPFKLGEYMATGNCVISARLQSVVQTVGEESVIYYTPESVESLVEAFTSLINTTSIRQRNGAAARETALKLFNAEDHSTSLCSFFQQAS